jgi:hypothetical protein
MRSFIAFIFFLSFGFSAWNQCNLVATANPQPATCSYSCDGTILYFYQNMGTPAPPYVVVLQDSDGNIIDSQTYMAEVTTIPYSGLCPDTYTILVQGTSCNFLTSATVIAPPPIAIYANTTNPDPGMNNGEVELIVNGGTGAYTYSMDGTIWQGSNTFTGLAPGSYSGYVLDANGCMDTVDFEIFMTDACNLVVTANPISNIMCYGACSGSIQYYYSDLNGNSPYYIELISGGSVIQTATNGSSNGNGQFTNLCAGVFTVQVTNAQGCIGSYTITLTQPPPFTISGVSTTDATAGNSDGSVTITATGGWPIYSFSLDGLTYQAGNTFTGLAAGVYIAYAQDNAGCISVYTFVIQQDPGCFFNLNTTANAPSCSWSCNAEISYIFAGTPSDPPFVVQLENNGIVVQSFTTANQTVTGSFTGLCSGDYAVVVTNAGGCQEVSNVTITQPSQLYANYTQVNPTVGNSNGSITVNTTGGTPSYQYSIDNGATWQSSNVFSGLPAGFYIINIMDANGCTAIVCIVLTETGACDFFLTATATANLCAYSCDGTVNWGFNDIGNNPPYVIELMLGANVMQTDSILAGNGGTGQFTSVCEGVYTVGVTDANGCSDTYTVYIDAPDYLTVTGADISDASAGMSNGTAEIFVTGGTAPYQFSINNGATWQSSNYFTGLDAGVYILLVEDANGCSTIFCFVVNEDPGCFINTTLFPADYISCAGSCDGSLSYLYVEGPNNGPYTVTLLLNGTPVSTTTQASNNFNGTFTGLCAGNYSLTVTNADGCSSYAANATLFEPAPVSLMADVTNASTGSSNGSATIIAAGGTGQYSYSLDNGATWQASNVFNGLAAGVYIVWVEDGNGCVAILTFVVEEDGNCNVVLTVFPGNTITCSGMCDAELNFGYDDQNAPNPPYTVTLTNSSGGTTIQTFNTDNNFGVFSNLCAGVYTVTVQDADGCTTIQTYTITSPTFMNVTATTVDATAGNSDGYATMYVLGGTPPYQYSTDNQVTWQTSNILAGLGAGVYIVYVQDANGCMTIFCFVLGDSNVLSADDMENVFSVYPNPSQGLVFIESENVQNVIVYDLAGNVVPVMLTKALNGIVIDLSTVAGGVYVLQVVNLNGETQRMQIIKQ